MGRLLNRPNRTGRTSRLWVALAVTVTLIGVTVNAAEAVTAPTVLWTAGGLSAGTDGVGNAARMTVDSVGNMTVVSGPAGGRLLAVSSYTPAGALRWQRTIAPISGTFVGDWVVAAPNGDIVATGRQIDSRGLTAAVTAVRFDAAGTLQWRVDSSGAILSVGRLFVDSGGNSYVGYNSILHKYSPAGALLWETSTSVPDGGAALSPDATDVVLTGSPRGGASWITAAFDATTGARRWLVSAPEGIAATDVVVDRDHVYVTGQGNLGIYGFLTVVSYARANGARLWRTDSTPASLAQASGLRIALAPDGSVVAAGQVSTGGYIDWWIVALESTGAVRWQVRRDRAVTGDEIPRAVFVLPNGTTVVSGVGGPLVGPDVLGNSYMQGVTSGISSHGTFVWEAFSKLPTVWAAALPSGDVCATGGYDALITCFQTSGVIGPIEPVAVISATPSTGNAPLTVTFDGSGSVGPNPLASWNWTFGDGGSGAGVQTTHVYKSPGTYTATLTVFDALGLNSLPARSVIVVSAIAAPPAAPTNLAATALSRSSVALTWTNATTDQSELRVERCKGSGCTNFAQVATLPGSATGYSDTGLNSRTTYSYRARAHNAVGDSAYSNIVSVRTLK